VPTEAGWRLYLATRGEKRREPVPEQIRIDEIQRADGQGCGENQEKLAEHLHNRRR
jgi:hypothetical protein